MKTTKTYLAHGIEKTVHESQYDYLSVNVVFGETECGTKEN